VLRRLYFLNSEHSKNACVGFYPQRGYRAFFELGEARRPPVVLPPSLLATVARHLPKLCEHLFRGEQYKCNGLSFRVQTAANNLAWVVFDRASITLKLDELEYLMRNLTTLANYLGRYKLAEADELAYAQIVVAAATFVPPPKEQT
jgi:Rad3-related DNA helicase